VSELEELLARNHFRHRCSLCKATEDERDALKAELRELREENRWVPVEERLPYEGESVLLTWGGHVLIGYHHERSDGFYSAFERVDDVTHWRPLPKPPEVVP